MQRINTKAPAGYLPPMLARLLGPALIVAATIAMLVWTWGTWPDPLVDFGQQLYTPWQLSQGRTLYRDIATYNGPLSQYWNSLWFRLFGASLRTLVMCNLCLLNLLIFLLYHSLLQIGSRFSAVAGCLTFVLLFAFGQFVGIGNYNYLCPYAHEMTHGALLSLGAVMCVWCYRRYGLPSLAASGLLLGLAFLTKAEVLLPGAVGTAVALTFTMWTVCPPRKRLLASVGTIGLAAVLPPLLSFGIMSTVMPPEIIVFGEQRILAELETHPPDWIVLIHKDTSEFGAQFFGRDYAQQIHDWIVRDYNEVVQIGARPLQSDDFGIVILQRNARTYTR